MNTPPRSPASINTAPYPTEFQQLIREKSHNFVDRPLIFSAITDFLHRHDRGYFTLIGAPGSGKSAILAKYVTENPHVVYYSAEVEGKNRVEQFLENICTQLLYHDRVGYTSLPDRATEGSWFLSLLLQKISAQLEPNQHLIVAIDALDRIDRNSQSPGSNIFYLPRYLPERVYFLLTRRPFLREKSGLLIETPSQILDLGEYPEQNREDVQAYIQQYLTTHHINEQEFSQQLTAQSENNFMYLSQVLPAIAQGFYPEPFHFVETLHATSLPPGLEAYYQSHWQRMKRKGLSEVELGVLNILVQQEQAISAETLAQLIDEDEYEVEEVLEKWIEFLQQQLLGGEIGYSLYHSSFRNWLRKQLP